MTVKELLRTMTENLCHRVCAVASLCLMLSVVPCGCSDAPGTDGPSRAEGGPTPEVASGAGPGKKPVAETHATQRLLSRAIEALGGRARLEAIKGVETVFEASRPGFAMRGSVRQEFPACFRQEQEVWDATVVHVSTGDEAWKTIDGVRVPVEKHDRRLLEEQSFMSRMSLLVDLEDSEEIVLTALGRQDGHDWLEVELRGSDLGPYRLGFDVETALLRQTRYETFVFGHASKTPVTLALSDYRSVSGVMVPFRSCTTIEGELLERTIHVKQIAFDPEPDAGLFEPPEAIGNPAVRRRETLAFEAFVLEEWKGSPDDGCKRLVEALKEHRLERTGPPHLLYAGDERTVCTVACPVIVPKGAPASRPTDGPALTLLKVPATDVLTTVVREPTVKTLKDAESRLREEAERSGALPAGTFRTVFWSEDLAQVQLPLK